VSKKRFNLTLIGLLVAAALAACGGAGPSPLDVTFTTGSELKFQPSTLTAQVGQTVNVTLDNTGALEHSFLIDELSVDSGVVAPASQKTISFTPSAAGTYTFYCNIAGHREGGMTGTLTVNP
jgi:uncharacterized cupredoxin-like copper-binding protein